MICSDDLSDDKLTGITPADYMLGYSCWSGDLESIVVWIHAMVCLVVST